MHYELIGLNWASQRKCRITDFVTKQKFPDNKWKKTKRNGDE